MENTYHQGLHEIQMIYGDLLPLDCNREVYLVAVLFKNELGLASSWDYNLEQARNDYARGVGNSVNTTVYGSEVAGGGSTEEIEDILVHHISSETERRWLAYASRIESADKETVFQELLPGATAITCSLSEKKTKYIRDSWKKFLEGYGVPGGEFSSDVRSEFVRNKIVWDTAKEDVFLRAVMGSDKQEVAA